MKITIKNLRRKLRILELSEEKPELILTKLFDGKDSVNFLNYMDMNGKNFSKYAESQIHLLPPFTDCDIENVNSHFSISVPALKAGKYCEYLRPDIILEIDAKDKTFSVESDYILRYQVIIDTIYEPPEKKTLDPFWEKNSKLDFKNRLKRIPEEILSDKKIFVKISNIFFYLFMTKKQKKKITDFVSKRKEHYEDVFSANMEEYENNIQLQGYYKLYAPGHIEKIKEKQKEIVSYLKGIGYKDQNENRPTIREEGNGSYVLTIPVMKDETINKLKEKEK